MASIWVEELGDFPRKVAKSQSRIEKREKNLNGELLLFGNTA